MAITRINNNQITDSVPGNAFVGVNAAVKLQDFTITAGKIQNNLTYGSDLTITGNLTVQGNTTAIDTINLVVEDPLILLAKEQTGAPALDIGFIGKRGTEDNIAFVWDESEGQFVTVFTTSEITNSTIAINSFASLQVLNITAANANITGNLTFDGSILGNVDVTGNVTAGNLISDAAVDAVTITASGNLVGNNAVVTGDVSSATVSATGNVSGGNLVSAADVTTLTVTASGNISGGNISTTGRLLTGTLETTGDSLIGGNLVVQGNLTFINVEDLRVEDPIIILGTGPNGAPLTVDDGKDRGIYMEYFDTATANAFMGFQNASGNMIIANDVEFSGNDIVQINSFGNLNVGNLFSQSLNTGIGNVTAGNIDTAGSVVATGNVSGGNITTVGNIDGANVNATSNVTGGNIVITGTADLGNIRVTGDDITNFASNIITINAAASDIDVRISGDTVANLLVTDAGTDTVLIGTGTPTVGASLKIGTTDSFIVPVGNIAQRPTATQATGMVRFSTTSESLELYDGIDWVEVGVPEFTVIVSDAFVGNGSALVFTLSEDSTTAGTIVAINGIVQEPTTAYAVAGNVLTFTEAPAVSDNIDARIITTTTTVTQLRNTSANAVVKVLETEATVQITGNLLPLTSNTFNLGSTTLRWNELFLEGSTITLGNTVIKNTTGNSIGFFGPNGTTPATIDAASVDTTQIASGTSSVAVVTSSGNIRANVAGNTVSLLSSTGMVITGSIEATGNVTGNNLFGTLISGTLTTAAQTNITSVGSLSSLSVVGTISPGALAMSSANAIIGNLFVTGTTTIAGNIQQISGNTGQFFGNTSTGFNALYAGLPAGFEILPQSVTNFVSQFNGYSQINNQNQSAGDEATVDFVLTGDEGDDETYFFDIGLAGSNYDPDVAALNNALGNIVSPNDAYMYTTGNVAAGDPSNMVIGTIDTNSYVRFFVGGLYANAEVMQLNAPLLANTMVVTGGVSLYNITKLGSNGVGNIGQSNNSFNTVFAKATSAQYADLAEMYEADAEYASGTVLCFGGAKEVTVCDQADSTRVAGVVSTNPSYLMNSAQPGEHVAAVALTGRVPTLVSGTVRKGDLMVSTENGRARANNAAAVGTVIGKALEDFDGVDGVIEVVVGRV